MKYNISEKSYEYLITTIASFIEVEKACIFGSRVLGNSKNGSDVDIALYGKKLTEKEITKISCMLNQEVPSPYKFDILNYNTINNTNLKKHIDSFGKQIFPF
jgi:uncharacterized protein